MKNWSRRYNNWSKISINDKLLLIKIGFILLTISGLNKFLPFKTFRKLFNTLLKINSRIPDSNTKYKSIGFIKKWAGLLNITCLPQALTVKYLFRSLNNVQLIIGVNKNSDQFNAHAWVEENGTYIIGDRPFEQYTPLWVWN